MIENKYNNIEQKPRFPQWLRKTVPTSGQSQQVLELLRSSSLNTVCEEAKCPNRSECFGKGTATFLAMGPSCSRNCLFCSIKSDVPKPLDNNEPERIANAVKSLALDYVVITSVTRDDLPDGGATHLAMIVQKVKIDNPNCGIEILAPDFAGSFSSLDKILSTDIAVFNHNIETSEHIFSSVRPRGSFVQSLELLHHASQSVRFEGPVKSGFMVGLGESDNDVCDLLEALKVCGVSIVTIGQYFQPSREQVSVKRFVTPAQFEKYKQFGENIGIASIVSGSYVRSSYKAAETFNNMC